MFPSLAHFPMTLKTAAVGCRREKLELIQSWRKGGNILSKMLNLCCETPVSLVLCVNEKWREDAMKGVKPWTVSKNMDVMSPTKLWRDVSKPHCPTANRFLDLCLMSYNRQQETALSTLILPQGVFSCSGIRPLFKTTTRWWFNFFKASGHSLSLSFCQQNQGF